MNKGLRFTLEPLRDLSVGDVRPYLWLSQAAVGLVLLIACVNVINLLLARAVAREREIAIRIALGAGRLRLIRQSLTESGLLAVTGGLLGVAFAWWWVQLLKTLVRAELPSWISIEIDRRVLFFALMVSLLAGFVAGLAPALHTPKPDLNDLLKEGAKGSQGGRLWLRKSLVVAEVALALVLAVGAGLLLKSFMRLQQAELGFNPRNLLTLRVALPWRKYNDVQGPERQRQFFQQLLGRPAAMPGVETASMTHTRNRHSPGDWRTNGRCHPTDHDPRVETYSRRRADRRRDGAAAGATHFKYALRRDLNRSTDFYRRFLLAYSVSDDRLFPTGP